MQKLRTHLIGLAAGAALLTSAASTALAQAPNFQITPSVVGGPAGPFTANSIEGSSSELLTLTPGPLNVGGATGSGWIQTSAFKEQSVIVNGTGLNNNYAIYITFSLSDTWTGCDSTHPGCTLGSVGSTYTLNSLSFTMFADPGTVAHPAGDDVPVAADASIPRAATVSDPDGNDKVLGTGSLIGGTAAIFSNGTSSVGASLQSSETFSLTAFGSTFFTSPVPFFDLAFDGFNNAGGGVGLNPPYISINDASGNIDFARIPEPASAALFGVGLLALGWTVRRRRKVA